MVESNYSLISMFSICIIYCCLPIYSKTYWFKTAHIFHSSRGLEIRYNVARFIAFPSLVTLQSRCHLRLRSHLQSQLGQDLFLSWFTCWQGSVPLRLLDRGPKFLPGYSPEVILSSLPFGFFHMIACFIRVNKQREYKQKKDC